MTATSTSRRATVEQENLQPMNLRDVASAPLWSTATLLLLAAGCSAGGGGDPVPFHPEDGDGAPATRRPDSSTTPAPPMLSGSASASRGGSTSAATPVVTSSPQRTPPSGDVAGSNSGVSIDHSGSMPSGDGSSGQSFAPPPPETAPLIREAAPTALSASQPGVFGVDTITTGLRDGPDYGTQTLYVPVDAEPPFASAVVVPGFLVPESTIAAWGPFLASHGIATLTIGTNTPLDLPDVRAKALLDGIETLKGEDQRNGSPLQGHMALDRFAVMGWSMGGGGTLIAANETPTLRAAVTLAAWSPGALFS